MNEILTKINHTIIPQCSPLTIPSLSPVNDPLLTPHASHLFTNANEPIFLPLRVHLNLPPHLPCICASFFKHKLPLSESARSLALSRLPLFGELSYLFRPARWSHAWIAAREGKSQNLLPSQSASKRRRRFTVVGFARD